MARRGTRKASMVSASSGGAAPLVHASVGQTAQLIHAPTSAGGGSGAPLVSSPTPQSSRRRTNNGGMLTEPTQVGGEKQPHQGFAAQNPKVGGMGLILKQMGDGGFRLVDANGNVRRTYTAGQFEHVKRRGNAGATLDAFDSAAFARFGGAQTEEEMAEGLRQRVAADKNRAQLEEEKRAAAEFDRRRKLEQDAAKVAREEDEKRRIERERRDAAEFDRRQTSAHTLRQDESISAEGRKQMDALNNDIATAIMSGRFSDDELEQLNKETDVAKKRILFADMYRANEPTPQETFAKNTYTDENGVVFSKDGSKVVYDPNANAQRQQEREDMRYQNALLRLSQGYTVTEQVADGGVDPVSGNPTFKNVSVRKQYSPEEQDAILAKMFPSRYPNYEPAPREPQVTKDTLTAEDIDLSRLTHIRNRNAAQAETETPATPTPDQAAPTTAQAAPTPAPAPDPNQKDPRKKWAAYAN